MEVVVPNVHGVHGSAAFTPDAHTVIAALGGEISDDRSAERDETEHLRYPRWEPEHHLMLLRETRRTSARRGVHHAAGAQGRRPWRLRSRHCDRRRER